MKKKMVTEAFIADDEKVMVAMRNLRPDFFKTGSMDRKIDDFHSWARRKGIEMSDIDDVKYAVKKYFSILPENKSFGRLIESELEKAEIVIAAKAIVDKVSKMVSSAISIEADDLMPMMDSLKEAYGESVAENFQKETSGHLRQLVEILTKSKDDLSKAVDRLEGVFNGEPETNDMASFDDGDSAKEDEPDFDMNDDASADKKPMGDTDPMDEFFAQDDKENAGSRVRKESVSRKRKALKEGLLQTLQAMVAPTGTNVSATGTDREKLEGLKSILTAEDYEILSQFPDQLLKKIFTAAAIMPVDSVPDVTKASVSNFETTPGTHFDDYGDDFGDDFAHDAAQSTVVGMEDQPFVDDLEDDFISPVIPDVMERLRESKNPEAEIFKVYRRVIGSCGRTPLAENKVAKAFGIDRVELKRIVREGEENAMKPARDWSKLYKEAKEDGLTFNNIVTFICDNTTDKRASENGTLVKGYRAAVSDFVKSKNDKVNEDASQTQQTNQQGSNPPNPSNTSAQTSDQKQIANNRTMQTQNQMPKPDPVADAKARQLNAKIKSIPGATEDTLDQNVKQNIGSVGLTSDKAPDIAQRIRLQQQNESKKPTRKG